MNNSGDPIFAEARIKPTPMISKCYYLAIAISAARHIFLPGVQIQYFGTLIAVRGNPAAWRAFYLAAEGKRRPADFIIPDDIQADALCEYLADLFQEEATPRNNTATQISSSAFEPTSPARTSP